jgi:hypothetical protein
VGAERQHLGNIIVGGQSTPNHLDPLLCALLFFKDTIYRKGKGKERKTKTLTGVLCVAIVAALDTRTDIERQRSNLYISLFAFYMIQYIP